MTLSFDKKAGENHSPVSSDYQIFELLKHPVTVINTDGKILYGNSVYYSLFNSIDKNVQLNWEHPFFPEYRKRVAQAYVSALKGNEKHCFAIINSPDFGQLPVEIHLFPMFKKSEVASILVIMKIVDSRMLSFDKSTLSIISEENNRYDNIHLEYSPIPILRIDEEMHMVRCSHSFEGFIGYTAEEILIDKIITFDSLFTYDYDKIKKIVSDLVSGESTFQRIGEVKITTRQKNHKIANLALYPIMSDNEKSLIEIVFEDITSIADLKEKIYSMNKMQLFSDIMEGFIHSLNNTINVILSKIQLMQQAMEKDSISDNMHTLEKSALSIVDQIKRIQNFIGSGDELNNDTTESLVSIVEDAIEFSKMQFKVESKDKKRNIEVEKKYFSNVHVKTNTRLLREIITSIVLKVAHSIHVEGTVSISLKQNNNLHLSVQVQKDPSKESPPAIPEFINIFSGIDIRQVAEKINMKIIEEESSDTYAITAIFPSRMIIDIHKKETDDMPYKMRDLDILIVEDEIPLQRILHELFDKMGNRVYICENGKEAIEEFKKNHYDLLITDYGIEGITGIELSARIKEINEETVTILLSGWMIDDIKTYKNVVDLFIPKPFKLDVLIKEISRILIEKRKHSIK